MMDTAIIFLAAIVSLWYFYRVAMSFKYAGQAQSIFQSAVNDLYSEITGDITSYSIFTDGHPYVWVEVDFQELVQRVQHEIPRRWPGFGGFYPKMECWCKVNASEKNIYIVPYTNSFKFEELKHYDDWLQSNKQVAENIAKYKAKNS